MRCSNCSAMLTDGTPICGSCGAVNETDPGELEAPAPRQRGAAPARNEAARSKWGAPKLADPAQAEEADDEPQPPAGGDATFIGTAPSSNENATIMAEPALQDEELAQPAPRRLSATPGARPRPATAASPARRAPSSPGRLPQKRAPQATEPTDPGDEDDSTLAPQARRRAAAPEPDTGDEGDSTEAPPPRRMSSSPGVRRPGTGAGRPEAKRPSSAGRGSGRPLVDPNKYAGLADERISETTGVSGSGQQAPAPAVPPVNPDEFFQNILQTFKQMAFEDKLESGGAIALLLFTFMPWRSIKGESDIGLLTWAGFLSMGLACGLLALMYLRYSARVPTFTAKVLSQLEMIAAAIPIPLTLIFIFTSIDRTQHRYGSLTAYAEIPEFGSVLSLLIETVMCAGAVLVMQREKKAG